MVMLVIPPLPEKVFHKIIEVLPNPSSVEIRLYGDFDFTSIDKQVRQLLPQVKFESHGEQIYRLRDPDKETILKIYNASTNQPDHAKIQRGISIHKVEWWLNGASIELTPMELRGHNSS